jgi:hypothetical protein
MGNRHLPITAVLTIVLASLITGCAASHSTRYSNPSKVPPRDSLSVAQSRQTPSEDGGVVVGVLFDILFGSDDDDVHRTGRGNLSGAMKKASDQNTGDRTVPAGDVVYTPSVPAGGVTIQPDPAKLDNRPTSKLVKLYSCFGLHSWSGTLRGGDYYGSYGGSISLGLASFKGVRPTVISLEAGFLSSPIQETSKLRHSLDGGVDVFKFGLNVQKYTTPYFTFMGHYFEGGFNRSLLAWEYKNDLIDENGVRIYMDNLDGYDLYIGTGWNPMQFKFMEVGLGVRLGVIVWEDETSEGFHNDVFGTFEYLLVTTNLQIKWWD